MFPIFGWGIGVAANWLDAHRRAGSVESEIRKEISVPPTRRAVIEWIASHADADCGPVEGSSTTTAVCVDLRRPSVAVMAAPSRWPGGTGRVPGDSVPKNAPPYTYWHNTLEIAVERG